MKTAAAFVLLSLPVVLVSGAEAADPPSKSCRRLPSGKPILKLDFKPDSEVRDIINWMTMVSCTDFVPKGVDLRDKRVTVPPQKGLLTLEDAYRLFQDTLAQVNLKVEPGPLTPGKTLAILPK